MEQGCLTWLFCVAEACFFFFVFFFFGLMILKCSQDLDELKSCLGLQHKAGSSQGIQG